MQTISNAKDRRDKTIIELILVTVYFVTKKIVITLLGINKQP